MQRQKVLRQLAVHFTMLLVPLIGAMALCTSILYQQRVGEFYSSTASVMENTAEQLDNTVMRVKQTHYLAIQSTALAERLKNGPNVFNTGYVVKDLSLIFANTDDCVSLNFILLEDGTVFGDSLYEYQTYFGKLNCLNGYTPDDILALTQEKSIMRLMPPTEYTAKHNGRAGLVVPIFSTHDRLGTRILIGTLLSVKDCVELLRQSMNLNFARIYIESEGGSCLFADDPADIESIRVNGRRGEAVYTKTLRSVGWTIHVIVPSSAFWDQIMPQVRMIILLSVVMLSLGLVMAWYMAKKLWKPIDVAMKTFGIPGDEKKVHYASVLYGMSARQYELKRENGLMREQCLRMAIEQLLFSKSTDEDEAQKLLFPELVQPRTGEKCFVMVTLITSKEAEGRISELRTRILNSTTLRRCVSFVRGDDLNVFVAWIRMSEEQHWREELAKLCLDGVKLGMGSWKSQAIQLRESYDEALTSLFYADETQGICAAVQIDASDAQNPIERGLASDTALILRAAETLQRDVRARQMSALAIMKSVDRLGGMVRRSLPAEIAAQTPRKPLMTLEEILQDQSLERLTERISAQLMQHMPSPAPKEKKFSQTVEAYIRTAYQNNLSVSDIAEEMGVSTGHASRTFKQETGRGLAEYIAMVRMEKAAELLRQTRMNIDEVAGEVGIYSRTTFLRLFRQAYGVTPTQYREMQGGSHGEPT